MASLTDLDIPWHIIRLDPPNVQKVSVSLKLKLRNDPNRYMLLATLSCIYVLIISTTFEV